MRRAPLLRDRLQAALHLCIWNAKLHAGLIGVAAHKKPVTDNLGRKPETLTGKLAEDGGGEN